MPEALCFSLQVCRVPASFSGPGYELRDLTSRMLLDLLFQESDAASRVEGNVSLASAPAFSFLMVHGQQELQLLRLKAVCPKPLC